MALVLKRIFKFYESAMTDMADPRMIHYPLMKSPFPITIIIVLYLVFVKFVGPKLMENRKPFQLRSWIIVYNLVQIVTCGYLVITTLPLMLSLDWRCAPVDYSENGNYIAHKAYIYFLLKILDLIDTVFFVLKKNNRQVTFLHVYHHTGIIIVTWITVKYCAGGHSTYLGNINSCVHVFMYSYYLLSSIDERHKQNVTLKRTITQFQLMQFLILTIIYIIPLFQEACSYPKPLIFAFLPQSGVMLFMFGDFYYKTYIKKKCH